MPLKRFRPVVRRRRVYRRKGYGVTKVKYTSRKLGVLKQLIPHTSHYFKRMGVQVMMPVKWNAAASPAGPFLQNPGIPLTDTTNPEYLNGWQVTPDGIVTTSFGSDGDGNIPVIASRTIRLAAASSALNDAYQFGGSAYFTLKSANEYKDFTSLFDRYKIVGIKLDIKHQVGDVNNMTQGLVPNMYFCIDYDDFTTPTSKLSLMQREGCKSILLSPNRNISVKWRPTIAQKAASDGPTTASQVIRKSSFLDCSDPEVYHLGFKFWIDNLSMNQAKTNSLLTITPYFILAFKDTL